MARNDNRGRKEFPIDGPVADGDVLIGEIVEDDFEDSAPETPFAEGFEHVSDEKIAPGKQRSQARSERKAAREAKTAADWDARREETKATPDAAPGGDAEEASAQRAQARSERREARDAKRGAAWDARLETEGRAPQREKNLAQKAQAAGTPVSRLRRDVSAAGDTYMENVRKSDLLKKKQTPKERRSQLTGMHKGYTSMMMMACVQPLSQGLSGESLMSTLGMSASMWMLSPNFRNQVKDSVDDVRDSITKKIKAREKSNIDNRRGPEGDTPLSAKWQRRLDKVERMERGDRDLFTAESAGMTEVALTENAYYAMREEGADIDLIRDNHAATMTDLYTLAAEDGVGAEDIARNARLFVGQRLEDEPELAGVFTELSHGQYVKGDPQEVREAGTNNTRTQWLGNYESRLGHTVTTGSFALREPMSAEQHQMSVADTMAGDLIKLSRDHGADGLSMGMSSYMAGWGIKDHPGYEKLSAANSPLGERLRAADTMRATMTADGISPADQQAIYTGAYVDAMTVMGDRDPALIEEWNQRYGADWKNNMDTFMTKAKADGQDKDKATATDGQGEHDGEFVDLGESEGVEPEDGTEGPGATEPAEDSAQSAAKAARKYRNARVNQNYNESAPTGLTGLGSDNSDYRDEGFEMG